MSTTPTPTPSNQASAPPSLADNSRIYLISFLLVIALLLFIAAGFTYRWYRIRKKRQRANALSRPLRIVRPSLWEQLKLSGRKKPIDEEMDDTERIDEVPSNGTVTPFPLATRLPSGSKAPHLLPVTAQAPRHQPKKSQLPPA